MRRERLCDMMSFRQCNHSRTRTFINKSGENESREAVKEGEQRMRKGSRMYWKRKKKPVGCGWNVKKKIRVQWQEIKRVRDEIKSKWEKMMKGTEKWFRCMHACWKLPSSIFCLLSPRDCIHVIFLLPVSVATVLTSCFCPD